MGKRTSRIHATRSSSVLIVPLFASFPAATDRQLLLSNAVKAMFTPWDCFLNPIPTWNAKSIQWPTLMWFDLEASTTETIHWLPVASLGSELALEQKILEEINPAGVVCFA
ncbi:hypothetical protein AK812_SmicGene49072 [Symbiodinium microadriaticum]|uniref:Uncharacterized protein n=1 Tax=Symbiodinium microadriaticum TaxID=2951 RepID=A0A1Q9ED36_SYMMI|nr:hypothetical protein AK812_SmicGene49072 [Symbiodinium microadriaticum]